MAEPTMSARMTRLAKKRGRVPALVTALGILALFAAQAILSALVGFLVALVRFGVTPPQTSGLYDVTFFSIAPTLEGLLRVALPFVVGVFLSLWLLAPMSDELTLRYAITRAVLASIAGTVLVLLVAVVIAFASFLFDVISGSLFVSNLLLGLIEAVGTALNVLIYNTPVVILAGLLLWWWLKAHPRDYAVVGLVDEL